MNDPRTTDDADEEDALDHASAWCLRIVSGPLTASEKRRLEEWLGADPKRPVALEQALRAWDAVGACASTPEFIALRRDALHRARKAGMRRWRPRRWKPIGYALAAAGIGAIAVAATFAFVRLHAPAASTFATTAGQRRIVTLGDGSKVSLDEASKVSVRYSPRGRALELTEGQATFEVAKDPSRPFTVAAAGRTVLATGTAFNIDRAASTTIVTLIHGRVKVSPTPEWNGLFASLAPADPQGAIFLEPGQQMMFDRDKHISVRSGLDTSEVTSWQVGKLVFDGTPLPEALERINRYARAPVTLGDTGLGAVKVSGVFDVGDTEAFIDGLTSQFPVRAMHRPGGKVDLLRR